MSMNLDDPRLTAYALGEMDPAERQAFEAELANDPDARRQVEQVRHLAGELTDQLASEPAPELTDKQRQAVTAAATPKKATLTPARPTRRRVLLGVGLPMATAAGIVIAFCVYLSQQTDPGSAPTETNLTRGDKKDSLGRGKDYKFSEGGKAEGPAVTASRSPKPMAPATLPPAPIVVGDARSPSNQFFSVDAPGYTYSPGKKESQVSEKLAVLYKDGYVRRDVRSRARRAAAGEAASPSDALRPRRSRTAIKDADADGFGKTKGRLLARLKQPANQELADGKRSEEAERRQPGMLAKPWDAWDTSLVLEGAEVKQLRKALAGLGEIRSGETGFNTETYDHIVENAFLDVRDHPLSTFSIDVDTASYSNVRRFLKSGQLPPAGAVRIEEMVNYFTYDYEPPRDGRPFAVHVNITGCPWAPTHRLVRIALKGKVIAQDKRPATNLVFLLDVSGSMRPANKLPLVKQSMKMLVERLDENDTVAIVVYAGSSGLVLDATTADQKETILGALDRLNAGGSTNGGQGIKLAYNVAADHFIKGGVNRVILCTDGDFNIGVTNRSELIKLIQDKAKTGVFLSVLGFGRGNVKDATMESLADKGNGNYAYIDTIAEARKVLVEQMTGTLVTIAKDVKIQVEFNPAEVAEYRLIGYENRILAKEDFNDDTKDAGEIGAGHTVTALYEIVPTTEAAKADKPAKVDPLKYQTRPGLTDAATSEEVLTVKLRHKAPDGDKSELIERGVVDDGQAFNDAPDDLKFAAAVASFGMILRDSKHAGSYSLPAVAELAAASKGADPAGRRAELVELVKTAAKLKGSN